MFRAPASLFEASARKRRPETSTSAGWGGVPTVPLIGAEAVRTRPPSTRASSPPSARPECLRKSFARRLSIATGEITRPRGPRRPTTATERRTEGFRTDPIGRAPRGSIRTPLRAARPRSRRRSWVARARWNDGSPASRLASRSASSTFSTNAACAARTLVSSVPSTRRVSFLSVTASRPLKAAANGSKAISEKYATSLSLKLPIRFPSRHPCSLPIGLVGLVGIEGIEHEGSFTSRHNRLIAGAGACRPDPRSLQGRRAAGSTRAVRSTPAGCRRPLGAGTDRQAVAERRARPRAAPPRAAGAPTEVSAPCAPLASLGPDPLAASPRSCSDRARSRACAGGSPTRPQARARSA